MVVLGVAGPEQPVQSSEPRGLFCMPRLGSSSGDFGSAVGHLLEDRGPGVSGAPGPRQGPGGTVEFANQLRVGRRTELGVLRAAAETGGPGAAALGSSTCAPEALCLLIWPLAKRRPENFGSTKLQWLFS